jgi:hypothetical protein
VGDAFLWTARILTGPLWLVSEFLLRRPIGWLTVEIERSGIVPELVDFFTFGPGDDIVFVPTVFYDFGFQPSFGFYTYWDRFLFEENRLSILAAFGGFDWLTWEMSDRVQVGPWQIGASFWLRRRPDFVFGGIGPEATVLPRARFGAEEVAAALWTRVRYWRMSDIEIRGTYRNLAFDDEGWDGEPSVGRRQAAFERPLPFGFATGYDTAGAILRVDLDSRTPGGPPEGGVRLDGYFGAHVGFGGLPELERWTAWGGSASVGADIGRFRVVGLRGEVHFVTPIDDSLVPFAELIDVGGAGPLSGFRPGRIRGQSAAALTLFYNWPIWVLLDAGLFLATGNAFGENLDGFDAELLRLSFGLALRPRFPGQEPFDVRLAFGTETFGRGLDVISVRFVIGNWNRL